MTKPWPDGYTIRTSSNWVEQYPRPEPGDFHDGVLEQRQAEWDRAHARNARTTARAAEIRAEREAAAAERHAQAAAIAEQRQAAQRAELEATLKRRFVAAGGTSAEWETEKDAVLAEHRRRATADDGLEARARQAQSSLYRQF
jgi:hypothetical protein